MSLSKDIKGTLSFNGERLGFVHEIEGRMTPFKGKDGVSKDLVFTFSPEKHQLPELARLPIFNGEEDVEVVATIFAQPKNGRQQTTISLPAARLMITANVGDDTPNTCLIYAYETAESFQQHKAEEEETLRLLQAEIAKRLGAASSAKSLES